MTDTTSTDSMSEVYLQISSNILESFPKFRPPVDMYYFDENVAQVKKYHEAAARLGKDKQEQVSAFAEDGVLFLLRDDYRVYAKHLSKKLGLVLTEDDLSAFEVAEIFFIALCDRMEDFIAQPTEPAFKALIKDISILVEYMWIDPCRAGHFTETLHTEYSLPAHSVNTMFVGLALFTMVLKGKLDRAALVSLALGLIMHDMGMANVPPFILNKPTKFLRSDRDSVENHIEVAGKKLKRLGVTDTILKQCVIMHHERLDGSGYPMRLSGKDLSMPGRLCAVADAFSALIAERPQRGPRDFKQAALVLIKDPKRYDPTLTKLLAVLVTDGVASVVCEVESD